IVTAPVYHHLLIVYFINLTPVGNAKHWLVRSKNQMSSCFSVCFQTVEKLILILMPSVSIQFYPSFSLTTRSFLVNFSTSTFSPLATSSKVENIKSSF